MSDKCPECGVFGGHMVGCPVPHFVKSTKEHVRVCSELAKTKERLTTANKRLADAENILNDITLLLNPEMIQRIRDFLNVGKEEK